MTEYGMVEWTTGVEYWTGPLECHAHKIVTNVHLEYHYYTCTHTIPWPQTWRNDRKKKKKKKKDHNWSGCQTLVPRLDQSENYPATVP